MNDIKFNDFHWMGPYEINKLLDASIDETLLLPPKNNSVYLVTKLYWNQKPNSNCIPLYVGSNIGDSDRFRTRIGDLIADMFGFYTTETGHHSGGRSLNDYCKNNLLHPKKLFLSWLDKCTCMRCAENKIYDILKPELNKKRPNRCEVHILDLGR